MKKISRICCLFLLGAFLLSGAGCAFSGSARVGASIRKAEPSPAPRTNVD